MGFTYEALKFGRETLMAKQHLSHLRTLMGSEDQSDSNRPKTKFFTLPHIVQTILHFFQIGLGYLLMLVAMTYNVWLFLAVLIGKIFYG